MLINQSRLSGHRIELNFMDLSLCISRFSILRISCSTLTFKQKPQKHSTISKIVWRVPGQGPSSRPQSQTQKNQNLRQMTIHDMFHWKMLIPKNFVIKCVLNRDAYLSGRLLYVRTYVRTSGYVHQFSLIGYQIKKEAWRRWAGSKQVQKRRRRDNEERNRRRWRRFNSKKKDAFN